MFARPESISETCNEPCFPMTSVEKPWLNEAFFEILCTVEVKMNLQYAEEGSLKVDIYPF